jgi:hypothetical protein
MKGLAFHPTPFNKCLLGITLPLNKNRFFKELESDSPKDFAKWIINTKIPCHQKKAKWEYWEREVIKPFKELKVIVEKLGICVVEDFSLSHLRLIKDFDVVTIIGHWLESCEIVEMSDDVYSAIEFVNSIPKNTECMLDLTICNSAILLDKIKKQFQNMIVFGNTNLVPYSIALDTYKCVIYEMQQDKSLNYLDATVLVRKKIMNIFN